MSHTPGPWTVEKQNADGSYMPDLAAWRIVGIEPNEFVIAAIVTDVETLKERGEANARLIAAAPELLEELKAYHDVLCGGDDCSVCALIEKIEGIE